MSNKTNIAGNKRKSLGNINNVKLSNTSAMQKMSINCYVYAAPPVESH